MRGFQRPSPFRAAANRRAPKPCPSSDLPPGFVRLFRRGRFADYAILDAFADSGSLLFTADGVLDPTQDSGGLLGVLRGELAGMERRAIAERTRRGREERRRQGRRAEGDGRKVGMPRGVQFDFASGEWSYVEPEASRVREAFRLFLGGVTNLAELARRIGVSRYGISGLLTQPLYKGIYRVDRRWQGGRAVPREPHECYEHEVLDPPLVSTEDWERTQDLLGRLRALRPPRKSREDSPLAYHSHLECAECGAALLSKPPHPRGGGWHYYCARARSHGCPTGTISSRLLEPAVDAALEARLGDLATLRRLIERSLEEGRRRAADPTKAASRRMTQLQNRRARVKDAYEAGVYGLAELKKRMQDIDGEITVIQSLLATEDEPIRVTPTLVSELVDVFSSWRDLAREEKRELLGAYAIRVRVRKTQRRHPPEVDSVVIGTLGDQSPGSVVVYKKMKRLNIE